MKRRDFFESGARASLAIGALGLTACKDNAGTPNTESVSVQSEGSNPFFRISLAQWSIHRMIREEGFDPYGFARLASGWGFEGLEYVNQLYRDSLEPKGYSAAALKDFVDRSNAESSKYNLPNLLIMIDGEGMLSTPDDTARKAAVQNHLKWIEAAADMGCHSIRVNLNGSTDKESWMRASVESLKALSDLGGPKGINILVENHGGLSSHAALHAEVMEEVGVDNCGTLPDFGNFCIAYDEDGQCTGHYDKYRGMRELLPFAKAISAKSHRFSPDGQEIDIDYTTMLLLIKNSGYTGYISVEYEGDGLTEEAGILATKKLLETSAAQLA